MVSLHETRSLAESVCGSCVAALLVAGGCGDGVKSEGDGAATDANSTDVVTTGGVNSDGADTDGTNGSGDTSNVDCSGLEAPTLTRAKIDIGAGALAYPVALEWSAPEGSDGDVVHAEVTATLQG
jgi:hypothetical protein